MNRKLIGGVILFAAIILLVLFVWYSNKPEPVHYGISPFQDTAMPVVAEDLGLYQKAGLDVELVTVAWEDVIPSLASAGQTIDVGIGSINLFLPRAENINVVGGGDVIFYYPFYVFKGASLVARSDLGLSSLEELTSKTGQPEEAQVLAAEQLRGLKVGVPKGTPYEQMLFALLEGASMNPDTDIQRVDIKLADALPALLRGDLDVIGAGVTQRTEAARHGHHAIIDMEGMGFAEIIGLVTTRHYASSHSEELHRLVEIWFESVDTLFSDIPGHAGGVLKYLAANASTNYTLREYEESLSLQEFPRSLESAQRLMLQPDGRFYWRRTWDIVNSYLIASTPQKYPIPYSYFMGDDFVSTP